MIFASEKERKLQSIVELENKLNEIQDVDVLLERILTETRNIVNADAGSIYVVSGDRNQNLRIKYSQNDTQLKELPPGEKLPYLYFTFPVNKKSIAGYVAYTGKSLNIPDCYQLEDSLPYKFNKQSDITTGYRTKSMFTISLRLPNGKTLGVLQIINALDKNGNVVSFDENSIIYITHFASSAVLALQRAYNTQNMIRRMLRMSEFRDPKETYPHVERVSCIAVEIYDRWAFNHNIPENEKIKFRDNLKIAAKFHDIGKVGISDLILKKTFPRFDENERSIMKGHTCIGAMLFYPIETSLDKMSSDVCLHHHERWDGGEGGYPGNVDLEVLENLSNRNFEEFEEALSFEDVEGLSSLRPLKGNEIPLAARIVAVADVFDALSHKRCYKSAWSLDDAFNEIQSESGYHFDPEVVLAFLKVKERIISILLAIPD